jgi:hypothetical protein
MSRIRIRCQSIEFESNGETMRASVQTVDGDELSPDSIGALQGICAAVGAAVGRSGGDVLAACAELKRNAEIVAASESLKRLLAEKPRPERAAKPRKARRP